MRQELSPAAYGRCQRAEDRAVHVQGAVADGRPRERLDGATTSGETELPRPVGVGHRVGQRSREVGDEAVRVDGRARAVLDLLDGHQPAGFAVDDDLRDAAGGRRDDGQLTGHRLEVDDAERLVDRGTGEDRAVREQGDDLRAREHLGDPDDALALSAQALHEALDLAHDLRAYQARRRKDELDVGG